VLSIIGALTWGQKYSELWDAPICILLNTKTQGLADQEKKKKKPDGLWNKLKMLHLRFSISLIWETCYRRKFEDTRHIKAKAYQCLTSKHTMRQWKLLSQVPKADAQTLNITPYCSSDPWLNKRCITLHIQLRSNPFISECRRQSILYGNSLRKHQISTFSITHDIHH